MTTEAAPTETEAGRKAGRNGASPPPPDARGAAGWRSWWRDLVLGVRLAVGGGRTSWTRLVLGTIGIGLAVAILLVAASVPAMINSRYAREAAGQPVTDIRPGVSPLYSLGSSTEFHGVTINGTYGYSSGPNAPLPPGLPRLPGPDEVYLSPALAALLDSDQGALLRARFPQRVVGTIGEAGLTQPSDLSFYAGAGAQLEQAPNTQRVYAFGIAALPGIQLDPLLLALLVVGVVVLLLPIVIFVGVSSRIAGAERDRRLAALRLVGAGSFQTRRIAAAESLVGAATGLLLGGLLFLLAKQASGGVELLGESVFSDDVLPDWPLVALVVLLVPVIAIGSSLLAMRRTVIEPLGVVRQSRPVRRRLWWRVALLAVGIVLMLLPPAHQDNLFLVITVAAGACALLIGVPALLPWLLERVVGRLGGGPPSWQLAVRRLQLDSGTPARVISGVAVVVAGAVALQTLLASTYAHDNLANVGTTRTAGGQVLGAALVTSTPDIMGQVTVELRHTPDVRSAFPYLYIDGRVPAPAGGITYTDSSGNSYVDHEPQFVSVNVMPCPEIVQWLGASDCVDGDAFQLRDDRVVPADPVPGVGTSVSLVVWNGKETTVGRWTVPATVKPLSLPAGSEQQPLGGLVITPGAFGHTVSESLLSARYQIQVDESDPDALEYVRNALARYTWKTDVSSYFTSAALTADQQTLVSIRTALLVGSLFTLLLAGASLLVLALEQIRERRRPLASLAAAGVPRSMLARSLLWQMAVPVLIGVLVAAAVGLALATLTLRLTNTGVVVDWSSIGVFCGAAIVLVLLITGLTLPALRGATRLAALRSE